MVQSYLENRTQQCSAKGSLSDSRVLTCGVPRGEGGELGAILGALLFLSYMNDLPNCFSNCELRMFADDTHLIYADNDTSNIESCLSEDLLNMNANKRTKTEFMLTGCGPRVNTLTAPISHKGSHSGGTGFNEITWCNN